MQCGTALWAQTFLAGVKASALFPQSNLRRMQAILVAA
jgi:hypothetical protein